MSLLATLPIVGSSRVVTSHVVDDPRDRSAEFEAQALPFLPHVARYARALTRDSSDADDLVQETFLRGYENWSSFRPESDCRRWLFAICRNVYLRGRERAKRFVSADDAESERRATGQDYPEESARGLNDLFDRIDIGPALERGLRGLASKYRDVVVLVDIEDRSYTYAATALAIPVGTVRSRLSRARRLLQQSLLAYARDLGFGEGAKRDEGCKVSPLPSSRYRRLLNDDDARHAGMQVTVVDEASGRRKSA